MPAPRRPWPQWCRSVDSPHKLSQQVFGAAHPHHAYLFANARANRLKVLMHDGFGVWLAARRLNQGKFVWGDRRLGLRLTLSAEQLQALVTGLPWQRLGDGAVILNAR